MADLREAGEVLSRETVAKLLRDHEIRGISPRPWTPVTTIPDTATPTIPDLVQCRFDRGELNTVWTWDITYLSTGQGSLYLCAVRDGCSRRVLGYAFSESLHTDVVETALRRAVLFRDGDTAGVIFHADRGCQYTSTQLADVATELEVRLCVGRTGVCRDNAQQESFWSTLKTEHYNRHEFATGAEAITSVTTWIEDTYNRRRRHSALRRISPVTFEHRHNTTANKAAQPMSTKRGQPQNRALVAGAESSSTQIYRHQPGPAHRHGPPSIALSSSPAPVCGPRLPGPLAERWTTVLIRPG